MHLEKKTCSKLFRGKLRSSCSNQTFGALSKMHFLLNLAHSALQNKSFFCVQKPTEKNLTYWLQFLLFITARATNDKLYLIGCHLNCNKRPNGCGLFVVKFGLYFEKNKILLRTVNEGFHTCFIVWLVSEPWHYF